MNSKVSLILKVLLLSAGLACIIKYFAPQVPIPATATSALIAVLLPPLLTAVALAWRSRSVTATEKKQITNRE